MKTLLRSAVLLATTFVCVSCAQLGEDTRESELKPGRVAPASGVAASPEERGAALSAPHDDAPQFAPLDDGPCVESLKMPIPESRDQIGVSEPQWTLPEDQVLGKVTGYWFCPDTKWIYTFDSGASVSFELGWAQVLNEEKWPAYVEDWKYGAVATVRGKTAAVEEPDQNHTGQVLVIENGYLIRVLGNGKIAARDLVATAEGLKDSRAS